MCSHKVWLCRQSIAQLLNTALLLRQTNILQTYRVPFANLPPQIHTEEEVRKILPLALKHQVPVTFRAAGTSLSGQALTDSVLLKLSHTGRNFRDYTVHGDGSTITVQPGLIGGEVNRILAAHQNKGKHPVQYKIGPDPSSIDSCMVGGWVAALTGWWAGGLVGLRMGHCQRESG